MYVLEYKELYIVPELLTKNRTCQSYRWKQAAVCTEREPLEQLQRHGLLLAFRFGRCKGFRAGVQADFAGT